ncbi:TnpV protein [Eubacteriales bacterium DFI.9.88]|nr:TnpV protein [Eubacteriales bacterium DFI.9.88]
MIIEYKQEGDYLIPNLKLDVPREDIGKYGRLRYRYLKGHNPDFCAELLFSGELCKHLVKVNKEALERFMALENQLIKKSGLKESLKREDQMEWIRQRNQVRTIAEELVLAEIIYD